MPVGASETAATVATASTLSTVATYAAIAAAAASIASISYNATQRGPGFPNAASSSRQVSRASANALPTQRALGAAEQLGEAFPGSGQQMTYKELKKAKQDLISQINHLPKGSAERQALKEQNKILGQQLKGMTYKDTTTVYRDTAGNYVTPEVGGANFSGYGTADIEGQLARQAAENQIRLGEKYGTQFAEEAKKEQELSDPEGTAARKAEYDLLQNQISNPTPISPLAGALDTQITDRLKAGSGLDTMTRAQLEQSVAQANTARAGGPSVDDVATTMTTGNAGAARRQAAETAAQSWLSSGKTPEEQQLQREQQLLADEGAFVGGKTPESQFALLSGAGQGATPNVGAQPLPGQPTSNNGAGYGVAAYQAQVRQQSGQANQWMAGLSSLLSGIGSTVKATGTT